MFDNCLELLVLAGRSLPHAMMMMIPEPWTKHESMSVEKRAFYEYHSCLMEPWDGPASIRLYGWQKDRRSVGSVMAFGLLVSTSPKTTWSSWPARWVFWISPPDRILQKGRLQPGRMFLIDTEEGRIVADEELKQRIAREQPYRAWLDENLIRLADVPDPGIVAPPIMTP
jgi:glutamate synthase (ferredoxin)